MRLNHSPIRFYLAQVRPTTLRSPHFAARATRGKPTFAGDGAKVLGTDASHVSGNDIYVQCAYRCVLHPRSRDERRYAHRGVE
jgi:hypothetical protein